MDKTEYYSISKKERLPKRCPIYRKCMRKAYSIYFFSHYKRTNGNIIEYLIQEGDLPEEFRVENVPLQSEFPSFMKWSSGFSYQGMCPEVNLFEHNHQMGPLYEKACSSLSVEFENQKQEQIQMVEYRHFSECSEFCFYDYEKNNRSWKKSRANTRPTISKKLRFEIFQRDNFCCRYCGRSKDDDGVRLHIDHKTPYSKGGKDDFNNLLTACSDCNEGKSDKVI